MEDPEKPEVLNEVRLHTVRHVSIAAFLGGPLAAGILAGINYSRMGRSKEAKLAYLAGLAAILSAVGITFLLPEWYIEKGPRMLIPLIYFTLAIALVKELQEKEIEAVLENGGQKTSYWAAAGWGVLCFFLTMGAIVSVAFMLPPYDFSGKRLVIDEAGKHEIYYQGNIDKAKVLELGNYLTYIEYFVPESSRVAHIKKEDGNYTLTLAVSRDYWENEETIQYLTQVREAIVYEFLDGPLTIELCDGDFWDVYRKKL